MSGGVRGVKGRGGCRRCRSGEASCRNVTGLCRAAVRHTAFAWPCAAATAFIAVPVAQRATGLVIRVIGE